jgi:hypothetical protein
MLIAMTMGKYLMNGYSVVKEQPRLLSDGRTQGKLFLVLHLFPNKTRICNPHPEKFFLSGLQARQEAENQLDASSVS